MIPTTLAETEFFDFSDPAVERFAKRALKSGSADKRVQAIELFYAVRDGLFYEIYNADFAREKMSASAILRKGSGLCIHKSIVYTALLRKIGIPAKLWITDVKNHLCSPQLAKLMGSNVFHYHVLVSLQLDGKWIKATPVFNARLCQLYRMTPLEFDGVEDCVNHAYDTDGNNYMEITHEHGEYSDLPYEMVLNGLRQKHASMFETETKFRSGSLVGDLV
ncbi:Transglutaminase-like superfamily protein [Litoreibacter janthinus]|uniref:Transglutaminase-like superfamily protein n=2 Tax=Litoreibacter janthinus TaxID=670154 RepID=A0A1I6GD84_9RHOB|nr:Transglutaminase-like superfamily protein [Litoreibacter janthinus]